MTNQNIQYMVSVYQSNKEVGVGAVCQCPSCGNAFTKASYQQAFCKTKTGTYCKDFYWNNVTPSKRNNTTRISPANDAYMQKNNIGKYREDDDNFDDDQSWDAHKSY